MQAKPGHSFSAACGPSVRKSAHRLFSKDASVDIQQGHRQMTSQRCQSQGLVLVVEDTTDLNFSGHGHTQGLGNLGGRRDVKGLSMHSALALSTAGEPLGLIGQHIWASLSSGRSQHERTYPIEQKESYKWIRTKQWVNDWLSGYTGRVLVVGDREADFYEHFAWPRQEAVELLVRAGHLPRKIHHNGALTTLGLLPQAAEPLGQMSVEVSRQRDRQPRTARLQVRIAPLSCPPPYAKSGPRVPMTLVHVKEQGTQGGDEPIEWFLLTTMLVSSFEQACQIVGFYALRWIIERFHFVLRTIRLGIVAITAVCIGMATTRESIFELVAESSAFSLVSLFVPLAAGLYWQRANQLGCILAMTVGLGTWLLCLQLDTSYPPLIYGLLASIAGMLVGVVVGKR
ncbi:hypothetical protein GCM10027275_31010 [Rhabdobacter roseus]